MCLANPNYVYRSCTWSFAVLLRCHSIKTRFNATQPFYRFWFISSKKHTHTRTTNFFLPFPCNYCKPGCNGAAKERQTNIYRAVTGIPEKLQKKKHTANNSVSRKIDRQRKLWQTEKNCKFRFVSILGHPTKKRRKSNKKGKEKRSRWKRKSHRKVFNLLNNFFFSVSFAINNSTKWLRCTRTPSGKPQQCAHKHGRERTRVRMDYITFEKIEIRNSKRAKRRKFVLLFVWSCDRATHTHTQSQWSVHTILINKQSYVKLIFVFGCINSRPY